MKLGQAELLVIDEAAAIPLPLVKNLLGPYLVMMASTINGYEGTGRSLSLKLMQQLRQQSSSFGGGASNVEIRKQTQLAASGKMLHELQLNEPIRYAPGDEVERWLNDLLCLNCCQMSPTLDPRSNIKIKGKQRFFFPFKINQNIILFYLFFNVTGSGCPIPDSCELYYVNRDTLFSFHKVSEMFLQRLMSLYVSSHYKNTPNDLQMLSDAPAHHIFCLLGPFGGGDASSLNTLPEILCVIQVCLEGEISEQSVTDNLQRGKRASGDLIPWTVSQQFQDNDFPRLAGARIVRIATHPDYQGLGYGQRAMRLLKDYYEGKIASLSEDDDGEDSSKRSRDDQNQIKVVNDEVSHKHFYFDLCSFFDEIIYLLYVYI